MLSVLCLFGLLWRMCLFVVDGCWFVLYGVSGGIVVVFVCWGEYDNFWNYWCRKYW